MLGSFSKESEIFQQLDLVSKENKYVLSEAEKLLLIDCKKKSFQYEVYGSVTGALAAFGVYKHSSRLSMMMKMGLGVISIMIGGEVGHYYQQKQCMYNLIHLPNSQLSYTTKRLIRRSPYSKQFTNEYKFTIDDHTN
jgi:hypothetical protein